MTKTKSSQVPPTVSNAVSRAEETFNFYLEHALLETGMGNARSMPAPLFLDHALALVSDLRHLAERKGVQWTALLKAADRGYEEDLADGRGEGLKPARGLRARLPRAARKGRPQRGRR